MTEYANRLWGFLPPAWKSGLREETLHAAAAFGILTVLAFAVCLLVPDLLTFLVSLVLDLVGDLDILDESGRISALALFSSNLQATAMIMLYGLVPFLRLTAMALGLNAMMLGVLAAWYVREGHSLLLYLAALLPHGVFELPAMVLAFGMGLYVCGQMSRRCRHDETALSLWNSLLLISRTLIFALAPLLLAAAVTEAYITPAFALLFT